MAENPDSVDRVCDVFRDFNGRRSGVLQALTTDYIDFYERCHPGKGEQCLVGLPNGTWKLKPPEMMLPCDLPEPVLGINFARDGMPEQKWAEMVAAHSDSWLLAVAFYDGVRSGFTKSEREKLFKKINDLPTVYEIVKSNDPSGATMLKKPKSCSTDNMTSPHKYESGAATKDGHNDGSSSYGQSESSGTYVNSSSDDSGAQTNESGAATEDSHNGGSSSHGQSKSSGTYVNSSGDDSGAPTDEGGSAMEDGHNEVRSSSEQSKSSGTYVSSPDDDSGASKDESGSAIEAGRNEVSSSSEQSKSSGTRVISSDDDSGASKDESGSALEDGHNEVSSSSEQSKSSGTSSSSEQSKSSGTHGNSSDDDSRDTVGFILF